MKVSIKEVNEIISRVSKGEIAKESAIIVLTSLMGIPNDSAERIINGIKQRVLNDGAEASPNGTIPQDQEGGEAENGQSQNGQEGDQILKAESVEDLPSDLDTAEEALTAYIRNELSREMAIKILILTEGDTEEEAAFEIDNLKVGATADS